MKIQFDIDSVQNYVSQSQKIRVLTESWVNEQIFCPNCGLLKISEYQNNKPVADFYCIQCGEEYELKSKNGEMGAKIVDGAYSTMIQRLADTNNPNFFFLTYNKQEYRVTNFLVIPKHFFTPKVIEKRNPLSPTARRAGWVGCNVLLQHVPQDGKVYYIRNGNVVPKKNVLENWQRTLFLRETNDAKSKSWIIDIMRCIDALNKRDFSLDEVYAFEKDLALIHPENKHIKDKIRQQLQMLRDKGYLKFTGSGKYHLI
jgi:type II restriction enzyme